jgi:hypothetical protein
VDYSIELNGSIWQLSEVVDTVSEIISKFEDPEMRVVTDSLKDYASYSARNILLYTSILEKAKVENQPVSTHLVDKVFEIITRTPILIERRNSQYLGNALSAIGITSACLGKINEFIVFMKRVVSEGLYISESSLQEHYGYNFESKKCFNLPASVENPYKVQLSDDTIYRQVFEKMQEVISRGSYPTLIRNLIKGDAYLNAQVESHVSARNTYFYKTDKIKNIQSLIEYVTRQYNLSYTDMLSSVFYNTSVIGINSPFNYTASDADYLNKKVDPGGSGFHGISAFGKVYVDDPEFFCKIGPYMGLGYFNASFDCMSKLESKHIIKMIENNNVPEFIWGSKALLDTEFSPKFFADNIDRLYTHTNNINRKRFDSKFNLKDIVNLLH